MNKWLNYECESIKSGKKYIIGIDEVGKGSLWGDVYVGGCVLPFWEYDTPSDILGNLGIIKDSKKFSNHRSRIKYLESIIDYLHFMGVVHMKSAFIDAYGINKAIKMLTIAQIDVIFIQLELEFGVLSLDEVQVLCDGGIWNGKEPLPFMKSIVKGDENSVSIAIASIKAKTSRDATVNLAIDANKDFVIKNGNGYYSKDLDFYLQGKASDCDKEFRRSFNPLKSIINWNPNPETYNTPFTYHAKSTSLIKSGYAEIVIT